MTALFRTERIFDDVFDDFQNSIFIKHVLIVILNIRHIENEIHAKSSRVQQLYGQLDTTAPRTQLAQKILMNQSDCVQTHILI